MSKKEICTECLDEFEEMSLASFDGTLVCGRCKETYLQKLREGVSYKGKVFAAEKSKIMPCPMCGGQAISFLRFTLIIDPRKIKCSNCKSKLRANVKLEAMFKKIIVYVFFMLAISSIFAFILKIVSLGIILFIIFGIFGTYFEYKEWKLGGYVLDETNN
ncbi:MAG: hypothetical protein HRT89_13055 [Lentisphaeria bacterium]|nr:hypothetical protein [Lentisphaeria bacterium]NQZ68985.1 hypothetical protein [Lentisphaeria bacterium]